MKLKKIAIKESKTMELKKMGVAGSLESSDVLVTIEANKNQQINITITSPFIRQFGQQIHSIALQTLQNLKITSCNCIIQDQGAIDEVLIARIVSALSRATNMIIDY